MPSKPTAPPERQSLLARALSANASAALIAGPDGRLQWVNQAFLRLSGYSEREALRKSRQQLGWDARAARILDAVGAGKAWSGETIVRHKRGGARLVNEVITPLRDEEGKITCFIALQHHITGRRRSDASLRHLATHDSMTGLPNKACFLREQRRALRGAHTDGHLAATLFIDLDRFKAVNDTYGHRMGDRLLLAVARRLKAAVRQDDLVARLGGDEFAMLLRSITNPAAALALAADVARSISRPYVLCGLQLSIGASIGVAVAPSPDANAARLLDLADQAMYRAKKRGGNCAELASLPNPPEIATEELRTC
ncbi:sensor domain-containing diguanylate cyclase [Pseudoduganella aquatica]|uniref:Diguanylate cyclase n=1 Tax=Pseudoduganella aquatica TaxID=2660641 RepID=A0A7X4HHT8_9BURK|nr:sensor domain-containing diguanylate cyclase [Pseudoduganella aquatica]MYN10777.1 diguanylate cyclase [Pseudoduganella aquatica]